MILGWHGESEIESVFSDGGACCARKKMVRHSVQVERKVGLTGPRGTDINSHRGTIRDVPNVYLGYLPPKI